MFVGAGGSEDGSAPGGIFTAGGGTATKVPFSPMFVSGTVWHKGVLYVAGDGKLSPTAAGTAPSSPSSRRSSRAPRRLPGLRRPDLRHHGRIYAGVSISNFKYDSRKSPQPYAQSIVSLKPNGKDIRVFASGLREPWQITFVGGIRNPFVSVLSQDNLKKGPPDFIIHPRRGDNYGFPKCNWIKPAACATVREAVPILLRAAQLADGHRRDREDDLRRAVRPDGDRSLLRSTAASRRRS